jgi:molecular chaperone DnaJ
LPHFGGGGRGDLYVHIDVQVPKRLSAAQRKLYEHLRELSSASAGTKSEAKRGKSS